MAGGILGEIWLGVLRAYLQAYLVNCSAGNIDVQLTEGFLPSKRKNLLQHTVDNEVSALARLAFYENLFIGQRKGVRCPH